MELNKIYNIDCFEGMKKIKDNSIDMILCDLPYGVTNCKWDKIISIEELWKEYNRIIKTNGAIVLTATMKFAVDLVNANRKFFRYDLVWRKSISTGFVNAKKMPLRQHENILVFYKKLPTYNPQGLIEISPEIHVPKQNKKEHIYNMDSMLKPYIKKHKNYPKSVLHYPNSNNKSLHPTQKPLKLFEYLILTYSNENDLILDNCMGSGTTAIACLETNRKFLGFENNEQYYNIACQRIKEWHDENKEERHKKLKFS